ncbi:hypothetical protein ALC57_13395 [Trachymyrmex cornetzi]|uniref:Uncharacterized protein n=1 Tax=Trachymyrmex cornetzi TaxID=471704 RepID=A0A195DMX2_9HYME|nr:hypothetical protein ALC57_13395 [Trachymyrmex cornetzi]
MKTERRGGVKQIRSRPLPGKHLPIPSRKASRIAGHEKLICLALSNCLHIVECLHASRARQLHDVLIVPHCHFVSMGSHWRVCFHEAKVKNNWPPAALPEIPDEKEETGTCAPHRETGIRVGLYSAKLTILPREEMGPPADDGCDAGKRNFTKVHVDPQLLGNSQTCSKAFNEVIELSVGVSSPLASNTHTSSCLSTR